MTVLHFKYTIAIQRQAFLVLVKNLASLSFDRHDGVKREKDDVIL
jgi:hypothetical protein